MKTFISRLTLGIAGALAIGIGGAITLVPDAFFASYGIVLPESIDLYSEIRAPGANLAVLGALIFVGAFKPDWRRFSAALGATLFLAYAAGRLVSIAMDGTPSSAILLALVIELAVGASCALALRQARDQAVHTKHPQLA
ncbi:DUF4345 domain-containing protein [uncultured Roseibium sp.]|uniref:DUF4345 domain-containing protein n=1 Tax=uncultured Roseibium sp. TaxID=1936171 RepID=UPI002608CF27|nr:DUF4345 domain-containing protein [uncultured Roseibium sp.]